MTELINNAEGGTPATTLTAANSGTSGNAFSTVSLGAGAALTWDNSVAAHGSLSYQLVPSATAATVVAFSTLNAASGVLSISVMFDAVPTVTTDLIQMRNASAVMAKFQLNASGKIVIASAAANLATSAAAVSTGTWYRFEMAVTAGADTATGVINAAVYVGDDNTTPFVSASSATANTGTANFTDARFGKLTTSAAAPTMHFDDIRTKDGTTALYGPVSANTAPVANAGPDQTGIEPFATVTLNGTGSTDADGDTLTYAWTQTAGTTVTLSSSTAASPTFTAPATLAGATLTFSLVVTDSHGAASTADTVSITVAAHTIWQVGSPLVPIKLTAL